MSLGWDALTFEPGADAIEQLSESWAWLLKDPFRPVLFTVLGDMFFARDDDSVWWLNTGTAEITRVADSVEFEVPFGWLVGRFVRRDVNRIFAFREQALRQRFGSG